MDDGRFASLAVRSQEPLGYCSNGLGNEMKIRAGRLLDLDMEAIDSGRLCRPLLFAQDQQRATVRVRWPLEIAQSNHGSYAGGRRVWAGQPIMGLGSVCSVTSAHEMMGNQLALPAWAGPLRRRVIGNKAK
jgi:hypothetical protein